MGSNFADLDNLINSLPISAVLVLAAVLTTLIKTASYQQAWRQNLMPYQKATLLTIFSLKISSISSIRRIGIIGRDIAIKRKEKRIAKALWCYACDLMNSQEILNSSNKVVSRKWLWESLKDLKCQKINRS